MKRTAKAVVALLVVSACAANPPTPTTPPASSDATAGFPVTIEADNGQVTVAAFPDRIVSLSAVATEMLFAVGAGAQVVAVDDQSNYPPSAPRTDLSGITPNLEAIISYEPDLVIITFDPGDLIEGLTAAGVPVIAYTAARTLEDAYLQLEAVGEATGHTEAAGDVAGRVRADLEEIVAKAGDLGSGVTYYHEIDALLFTATSSTFFGEIYGLFGMVNIADPADESGSALGYPQLTSEFVVAADPDIIFLANVLYGESRETVSARPGWGAMTAVASGAVVELDSDLASRWGPRIVDFARSILEALQEHEAA